MGDVFLGFDERLQRRVALKTIRAERRLDLAAQARFAREARLLSQLDHPHICRVYDYLSTAEADVLVLEYIQGRPLSALLGDAAPLAQSQKLRLAEQIALALVAAHERGIVHRDLKPGNVMVTDAGDVKVVDFGLAMIADAGAKMEPGAGAVEAGDAAARLPGLGEAVPPQPLDAPRSGAVASSSSGAETAVDSVGISPLRGGEAGGAADAATAPILRSGDDADTVLGRRMPLEVPIAFRTQAGRVLGTPFYMSPEQARGEAVTPASDLFAFGLILQELFTGVRPHPTGLSPMEIVERVAEARTEPPGRGPRPLLVLIQRLKAGAPAARPTAVDALERLRWIRDRPRRRAVWFAAAAGIAVLALAGVKYTLDVRQERDRANRHRSQAEDLIGFMLGDLREKLDAIHKLGLLSDTGDKALAYFASLPSEEVTDEDRFRQVQALLQVGQVRIEEGRMDTARQLFRQALGLVSGLADKAPDNLAWHAAVGTARFWVGYIRYLEGNLDEALEEFRVYLGVAQRLAAREPTNPDWQMELAQARNNLGAVFRAKGDQGAAIGEFREVVATKQRLVDREPSRVSWVEGLADSQSWLADALREGGDLGGSLRVHRDSVANLRRLRALDPDNRRWQHLEVIAHLKVALVLRLGRDLEGARQETELSLEMAMGLSAYDPTNVDWQRELGSAYQELGQVQLDLRRVTEACATLEAGERVLLAIHLRDSGNTDHRQVLSKNRALLSRAYEMAGRYSDALGKADAGLADLAPIRSLPEFKIRRRLSEVLLARTRALVGLGKGGEALGSLEQALEASTGFGSELRDPELLALRAEALLRAGRREEAGPLLQELRRQDHESPELNEALAWEASAARDAKAP